MKNKVKVLVRLYLCKEGDVNLFFDYLRGFQLLKVFGSSYQLPVIGYQLKRVAVNLTPLVTALTARHDKEGYKDVLIQQVADCQGYDVPIAEDNKKKKSFENRCQMWYYAR